MFADTDECKSNPCHANANCTNTPGSYDCTCKDGYKENGDHCEGKIYKPADWYGDTVPLPSPALSTP